MVHITGELFKFNICTVRFNLFNFCFLEAQEKLKKFREDNERKSKEVLDLWESSVKHQTKQLGNDRECHNTT